MTGMFPDSLRSSSEEEEKKPKEKRFSSPIKTSKSSRSTWEKCRSRKDKSDDYKVDRRNKGAKKENAQAGEYALH